MEGHEGVYLGSELVVEKILVAVVAVDQLQDGFLEEAAFAILQPLMLPCQALNDL